MTIVYFGSDEFAKNVLMSLIDQNLPLSAVVTVPDKKKGRSQKLSPTPVKEFVLEKGGLLLFSPEKASSPDFLKALSDLKAELFVVVSYGKLLRQSLLDLPLIGTINVHPSILPKYRGPSPIQSAVLAGEMDVGVTIMEVSLELDAGDVISCKKMSVGRDDTFGEVEASLCEISKQLLVNVVKEMLLNKQIKKTPQDHTKSTYTSKILPIDAKIDFKKPAHEVHNLIRGMSPRPGARCDVEINGMVKNLKILRSTIVDVDEEGEFSPSSYHAGDVAFFDRQNGFVVKCKDRFIRILLLQLEGKKEMLVKDFVNGFARPVILKNF